MATFANVANDAKVDKMQKLQKLQKLQQNVKVQNKTEDFKPIAYKASRAPFSRFGNKDWQKLQKLQK